MSGKPAARLNDPTACPLPGHGNSPITAGSPDVLIDGLAAAREGDATACGATLSDGLIPNVLINGMPVAVLGSMGTHGNAVTGGSGTVLIGTAHSPAAFVPPPPLLITGFDEQFRILSEEGQPLANVPYFIRDAAGRAYKGVTDESGKTPRIFTTGKQELQVSVGVHALELWGQA